MKTIIKNHFSPLTAGVMGVVVSSVMSGNAIALETQPRITQLSEDSQSPVVDSLVEKTAPLHLAQAVYRGKASWYGGKFHGRQTANGEIYNSNAMTAAHKTLPFNTRVRVTNLANGRSVVVRINDRGPFIKGRIIDVSAGAARKLNMINSGVANVKLEILGH